MGKQEVVDYVMHTPGNSNEAVLRGLLNDTEYVGPEIPTPTSSDNGKILSVDWDGSYILIQSTGLKNLVDGTPYGSVRSLATDPSETLGMNAVVIGSGNKASGVAAFAQGSNTEAAGANSHAEGSGTKAIGAAAHAEGTNSQATETAAHAEGSSTYASGLNAHAEGSNTHAVSSNAHAEGYDTTASAEEAHAEGSGTLATARYSHAQNYGTMATGLAQTAIGAYNINQGSPNQRSDTDYALIIGNGESSAERSNALAVRWDGAIVLANGTVLTVEQLAKVASLA